MSSTVMLFMTYTQLKRAFNALTFKYILSICSTSRINHKKEILASWMTETSQGITQQVLVQYTGQHRERVLAWTDVLPHVQGCSVPILESFTSCSNPPSSSRRSGDPIEQWKRQCRRLLHERETLSTLLPPGCMAGSFARPRGGH